MSESSPRIAALEAQLAEAQERLAMAVEALSKLEDLAAKAATAECNVMAEPPIAGPFGSTLPPRAELLARARRAWEEFDEVSKAALAATAEAVAQHTAEVEQRGANQMLDRIRGALQNWPDQGCDEVVGRAVDEIVAKELDRMAEDLEDKARGGAGVLAYRIAANKCRFRATELRGRKTSE